MAKGARIAGLHRAAYGRKPAGLSVANMAIEGCGKICPPTQSNSRNCHVCREIKNRLYANRRGAALGDLCFSAHCSCLYSAGNGTLTAAQVNNGSNDACGILNLHIGQAGFTCANVGANTVVLTVTDVNNNTSTCSATVTVQDLVAPNAICQPVTVQLDNSAQ